MAEWIKENHTTISEVAKAWGLAPIVLQRPVRGNRWPSALILVKSYQISNGEVTLADWIETCRPLLDTQGITKPGDVFHDERPKGRR